jgi:serine/threonine protein kinase
MGTQNIQNDNMMLRVGTTLQMGKYRIDRYLSSGGFGNTYLATNVNFNERVAIKEFFMKGVNQREGQTTVSISNRTNTPQFIEQKEKFKKEARRLRNLHNDHIVAVSDLFDENGTTYYVMDYIDGESLRDKVNRLGCLPEKDVRAYLRQVLDALEEVHRQKMFHLDLKPANIMVGRTGQVRVIDFGASKQQKSEGGATSKSAMCYTPGYAPIEQKDQQFDKFGPWTDLYALGATLYNALTGEKPPTTNAVLDEGEDAFHFPTSVSEDMQRLIIWMMRNARRMRPQSVNEVREFLEKKKTEVPPFIIDNPLDSKKDSLTDENEETILGDEKGNRKDDKETDTKKRVVMITIGIAFVLLLIWLIFPSGTTYESFEGANPDTFDVVDPVATDSVYQASFKNAVLGDYLYTGPVNKAGNPDGKGEAVFLDKSGKPEARTYKGDFVDGVFESDYAEYVFYGDTYSGSFKSNYYEKGTLRLADSGEYFEGYFSKGQPHTGTWYNKQGKVLEKIGQ